MAVVGPVRELQDETVCPLCSRYFEDPVAIDCDHSYCRACITGHWQNSPPGTFVCPQCFQIFQRMHLRTNVQLSVMVKIAKNLNFAPVKQARRATVQQRPLMHTVQYNADRKIPLPERLPLLSTHAEHSPRNTDVHSVHQDQLLATRQLWRTDIQPAGWQPGPAGHSFFQPFQLQPLPAHLRPTLYTEPVRGAEALRGHAQQPVHSGTLQESRGHSHPSVPLAVSQRGPGVSHNVPRWQVHPQDTR